MQDEQSVRDEDAQVIRELECRVESLHEGDRPAAVGSARALALLPRMTSLPAEQRSQRACDHLGRELRAGGEVIAHLPREGENPLTHRDARNHAVDEMIRGVEHSASGARRAQAAALAAEGDEVLLPTGVADDPYEAVLEQAATEVLLELGLHVAGQASAVRVIPCHALAQGGERGGDQAV